MLNLASLLNLTALLNLRSLASKRSALSSSDLDCRRTNPTIATSSAKQIKTNKDRKNQAPSQTGLLINLIISKHSTPNAHTVSYPNLKKYLSNSTENSLLRPIFKLQRYNYYNSQDSNSLTQIQAIDPTNVTNVFNTVVSKSDKVPTRELSSYIKTELLRNNSRKFYRLVITSEDTHYKQIIKKAYIMSLERALLILFIT
ncbi:hypothetical protein HBI32_250720 [Parastagonospora nodorum]|nr:hypothetical protein HBI32_250720 [Parastagonospora nodorum]